MAIAVAGRKGVCVRGARSAGRMAESRAPTRAATLRGVFDLYLLGLGLRRLRDLDIQHALGHRRLNGRGVDFRRQFEGATAAAQAFVLALAIAPLAFAAAIDPRFRVAPFSAVLVLLLGADIGQSPIASAATRVLEVLLGGVVAVAVSVLVLPERANRLGLEAAGRILKQIADALPKLLSGFTRNLDAAEISGLLEDVGRSVAALQEIAAEARRERMVPFARAPDQAPLSRTLLRLRHDLIILGRAAASPLPADIAQRLGPLLTRVGEGASAFLWGCATALAQGRPPPPLEPVEAALQAFDSEVASLRSEGLTRALSTDEVEPLFALGFAFEQLRHDFPDLARCVQELAGAGGRGRSWVIAAWRSRF